MMKCHLKWLTVHSAVARLGFFFHPRAAQLWKIIITYNLIAVRYRSRAMFLYSRRFAMFSIAYVARREDEKITIIKKKDNY